ncbi:tyrosine-type recombinase/integrase [Nocardia fluminea]|uniref:tyrosine-type recombinase/integrase n=1 Tax=Nocardia fluminea TaxID=134984 RepID=UPI0033E23FFA
MAGRRGNNEGSITTRPNGTYQGRVRYTDPITGKKVRQSVYGKTSQEVRDKIREINDRVAGGSPAKDAKDTVAVWVKRWRETSLLVSNRSDTTKEGYARACRTHIEKGVLAEARLDRLRPTDIEEWVVDQRKRYAPNTVRLAYTVLRAALDGAVRDGLIARNPAAKVPRPRVEQNEAVSLSPHDVRKVLTGARRSRYYGAVLLLAHTGLRRGEACGLRWVDIDFTKRELSVKFTLSLIDGKHKLTPPKTKRSRRRVPMSDELIEELKRIRLRQKQERLRAGDQWRGEHAMVFTTQLGDFFTPQNLFPVVRAAAIKSNVPDAESVGPHTLRHSAATAWLEAGIHIKAVADLLGHSSIAITGDLYGHTTQHQARSAVDALAEAIRA